MKTLNRKVQKAERSEMDSEFRNPRLVQEELADLQELLRDELETISKYPDHSELLILHESSLKREQYLLHELEESLKRFSLGPFDIALSGETVRRNGISLAFLGRIVTSLEGIFGLISQQSRNKISSLIKDRAQAIAESERLYLVGTSPGSFRIILSSQQPAIGASIAHLSLERFNELLDCKDDENLLKGQINSLGLKVIIRYKGFLELLYKNESNVIFYDKMIPEGFHRREISKELAKDIHEVLGKAEPSPDEYVFLKGTLKGLSLISQWFEFLVDESEEKITGSFNQKLESDIKDKFDKTSICKFRVSKQWIEIKDKFDRKYELIGFED